MNNKKDSIGNLDKKTRSAIRGWCINDWANSAFFTSAGTAIFPIYFVFVLVNAYLLYVISPDDFKSKYFKSKNIGPRILFYIVLLLISGLITNGPVELLI